MAVLSITAAQVLKSTGAPVESGTAAATITAGQALYKDSADDTFDLCDNDATNVAADGDIDNFYGIALNGASSGQPLDVQTGGNITMGAGA